MAAPIVSGVIALYMSAAGDGKGDVNGDGQFTSLDALRVQKHMVGMLSLAGAYFTACDATRDGKVSSLDALRIQKTVIQTATITQ